MISYLYLFISTCMLTLLVAPLMIIYLKKLHIQQYIRKDGPASHLSKQGVPTVGGLIFLIPMFTLTVFVVDLNENILFILYSTIGFALIGFIDDIVKIKCRRNLGLTVKEKLTLQTVVSILIYALSHDILDSSILIPNTNYTIKFGSFYFIFFISLTIATVNASNLTDGLDGLLAGVVLSALIPFAVISYSLNHSQVFLFILISMGAILGFLLFNKNPAKVFMGDTGSLALGGLLAGLAFVTKTELLFLLIGGVLVIEALSVVIQLTSLKTRKKRVFKMAPIHHTFELMGWHETKVVKMFWIINFTLSCLSLLLFL